MDRLEAARRHLATALDALGHKMEAVASVQSATMEPMREMAEAEAVRAERDRLLLRLQQLEQESRALMGITEDVESRLDGAIAEIREVLALVA